MAQLESPDVGLALTCMAYDFTLFTALVLTGACCLAMRAATKSIIRVQSQLGIECLTWTCMLMQLLLYNPVDPQVSPVSTCEFQNVSKCFDTCSCPLAETRY